MHLGITGPVSTAQLAHLLHLRPGSVPPAGMGGVPVNNLILELHKRGFQLSVFSHSLEVPEGKTVVLRGDNLTIYYGHYRPRARHRIADLYAAERRFIASAIQAAKPDLIHAHWQYEWGWGALDSGVPTLLTCHDSPLDVLLAARDAYRAFRLAVAAIVLRKATHLTTVSPYVADRLKRFTRNPVRVIPNVEPVGVFDRFRTWAPPAEPSVVMVNNAFDRRKNVTTALRAFRQLGRSYPGATLHLYGTDFGPGEAAQRWAVRHDCARRVAFHGPLGFEALMDAIARHDIFLHTSLEESFGMVLVEASAMGLPVVAGRQSGGVPWVLPGGSGLLVDVRSPEEVAGALGHLLANPESVRQLCERGRQNAVARFSPGVVVDQYINAYHHVFKTAESTSYSL